jgi:hypothetical protein
VPDVTGLDIDGFPPNPDGLASTLFSRPRFKKEPPSAGKKTLLSQREFLEAWGS